jgi:hypothetical protein
MPMVHEAEDFYDLPNLLVEINSEIIRERSQPNVQILCLDHFGVKNVGEKVRDCVQQLIQFGYFCTKTYVIICDLTGTNAGDDESSTQSERIHSDLRRLTAQWSCYASYIDLFETIHEDHWVSPHHLGQHGQEKLARVLNRHLLGIPNEVFNF